MCGTALALIHESLHLLPCEVTWMYLVLYWLVTHHKFEAGGNGVA